MRRVFTCGLCDAMCGLHLEVLDGRVESIRGNPDDVFSRGHICPKGPALREMYEDPDRLRAPVRRAATGLFQKISWEEAFDLAAEGLRAVRKKHGRDAVALYVGNPVIHSTRAAFASQLLQMALGTHNRFDPNSQDSNPKFFAAMQLYGDGLSLTVPDVDRTDFFLMLGTNPAVTGGSMMALGDVRGRLQGIRKRGGRMVLVDPRRNETAAWCDEHHFIRPGSDAAFLLALLHVLFEEALVDDARVRAVASGLDKLRQLALGFSPERVAPAVGIEAATTRRLARELAAAKSAVVYGRIGVCQNEFGPVASWLIEALNVVTGNFDRAGGAMFPTPAADIGPVARALIGNNYGRWTSRVRGLPEFLGSLPSATMAEEMEAEGGIRALVVIAGNPVSSTPNGTRLAKAVAGLEFRVSIDMYLNETSRLADVVLPPAHALECGNFDLLLLPLAVRNFVKAWEPALPRSEGALDDWEIASGIVSRLKAPRPLRGLMQRALRDLPERLVDLFLGRSGLSLAKLRAQPDGIDLGALVSCRERKVFTIDGRVRLVPEIFADDLPRVERFIERARDGLVLIGRRDLRSNNSWMHNVPSLAKGPDRSRLWMNPRDAERLGLAHGARVRIKSRAGEAVVDLSISPDVMPGVVSLPHGFGHAGSAETMRIAGALAGASANALTDELFVEPIIGTSVLNGVPVSVSQE